MRSFRKQRTGKDHLFQNLRSKQGMRLLESEGQLQDFKRRSHRNVEEISDWENYMRKGKKYSDVLEVRKPDVVQRINEKKRAEEEQEREKREKAKDGEWCYNGEMGEYYWSGAGEPEHGDNFECEGLSGEELRKFREEENKMYEAINKERKKAQKENRKQKERDRKEAMNNPLEPLPEKELCEYEKMREKNIKEREEAMAASNFFEDLQDYKKTIGLTQEADSSKTKKEKNLKKKTKKSNKLIKKPEESKMAKQENEKMVESNKNIVKTVEEVVDENQRVEALEYVESKSRRDHVDFHIDEWYLHDCFEKAFCLKYYLRNLSFIWKLC